jgi:hypothetical protein
VSPFSPVDSDPPSNPSFQFPIFTGRQKAILLQSRHSDSPFSPVDSQRSSFQAIDLPSLKWTLHQLHLRRCVDSDSPFSPVDSHRSSFEAAIRIPHFHRSTASDPRVSPVDSHRSSFEASIAILEFHRSTAIDPPSKPPLRSSSFTGRILLPSRHSDSPFSPGDSQRSSFRAAIPIPHFHRSTAIDPPSEPPFRFPFFTGRQQAILLPSRHSDSPFSPVDSHRSSFEAAIAILEFHRSTSSDPPLKPPFTGQAIIHDWSCYSCSCRDECPS